MHPMGGDPPDDGSLQGHAAHHPEQPRDPPSCPETLMREIPMIAQGDPKSAQQVEANEEDEIHGRKPTSPQGPHRRPGQNRKEDVDHQSDSVPEPAAGGDPVIGIRVPGDARDGAGRRERHGTGGQRGIEQYQEGWVSGLGWMGLPVVADSTMASAIRMDSTADPRLATEEGRPSRMQAAKSPSCSRRAP